MFSSHAESGHIMVHVEAGKKKWTVFFPHYPYIQTRLGFCRAIILAGENHQPCCKRSFVPDWMTPRSKANSEKKHCCADNRAKLPASEICSTGRGLKEVLVHNEPFIYLGLLLIPPALLSLYSLVHKCVDIGIICLVICSCGLQQSWGFKYEDLKEMTERFRNIYGKVKVIILHTNE